MIEQIIRILQVSIIGLISTSVFAQTVVKPSLQPNVQEHRPFLFNDWMPDRPSVLVFKDPFCPYCIRDIPKLKEIVDYNVFLFWSPILGQRSVKTVEDIFRCPSVVASTMLEQVAQRQSISCNGDIKQALKSINDAFVAHYDINSVPSYYLQGKRVSLSYLKRSRPVIASVVNGVKINWPRYRTLKIASSHRPKVTALILPSSSAIAESYDTLVAHYKPKYLIPLAGLSKHWYQEQCDSGEMRFCDSEYASDFYSRLQELVLLLELNANIDFPQIINSSGQLQFQVEEAGK